MMTYLRMKGRDKRPLMDSTFAEPVGTAAPPEVNDNLRNRPLMAQHRTDLRRLGRRKLTPADMRDIRELNGASERVFAAVLDVPVPTLRGWEAGRIRPEPAVRAVYQLLRELGER